MKTRKILAMAVLFISMGILASCDAESTTETQDVYEIQGVDRSIQRPGTQGSN